MQQNLIAPTPPSMGQTQVAARGNPAKYIPARTPGKYRLQVAYLPYAQKAATKTMKSSIITAAYHIAAFEAFPKAEQH